MNIIEMQSEMASMVMREVVMTCIQHSCQTVMLTAPYQSSSDWCPCLPRSWWICTVHVFHCSWTKQLTWPTLQEFIVRWQWDHTEAEFLLHPSLFSLWFISVRFCHVQLPCHCEEMQVVASQSAYLTHMTWSTRPLSQSLPYCLGLTGAC